MSCVKVEVAVLGSPSLISLMVSVDVKHHERRKKKDTDDSELRSCVKVEVDVLAPRPCNNPDGLCGCNVSRFGLAVRR